MTLFGLLFHNAPRTPQYTPFSGVSINAEGNSIALPNRIFTCTEIGQQFQCQTEIQNRTLELTFEKGDTYEYDLKNCQAQYDGRSLGCQEVNMNYTPILANSYDLTNLGLSPQVLQRVRQKYVGVNTLMQLGETGLTSLSMVLSLVAGILSALCTWFKPGLLSKAFASLTAGCGASLFFWFFLGSVSSDVLTSYGLAREMWQWLLPLVCLFAGTVMTVTTALLLWRNLGSMVRLPFSIMASLGVFGLGRVLLLLMFAFGIRSEGQVLIVAVFLLAIVLAIAAARWLWVNTQQSIRQFLSLGNYVGAATFTFYGFLFLLLGLGYAD
ncbi:MAG: hypothetical protein F6K42_31190 [Leptolyngbya sp. SIO1D8]|nr:hypothetical protein [Leptolyngbya sp. SIO1D8]